MKKLYFLLIFIVLFSCEKEASFTVTNPMNVDRTDEVLVFTKDELAQKIELKEGLLPVFEVEEDNILPSQLDDLDGDGEWDEAIVLVNLEASQILKIEVNFVEASKYPEFEKRTNLRL